MLGFLFPPDLGTPLGQFPLNPTQNKQNLNPSYFHSEVFMGQIIQRIQRNLKMQIRSLRGKTGKSSKT